MSRRECKHGATCGAEYCILDNDWFPIDCDSYEDSGWRHPSPRPKDVVSPLLDQAILALWGVEHERPQFGDASLAKRLRDAKARVTRLRREMRYAR